MYGSVQNHIKIAYQRVSSHAIGLFIPILSPTSVRHQSSDEGVHKKYSADGERVFFACVSRPEFGLAESERVRQMRSLVEGC